ncbi:MAG TPA: hypothetical protein VFP31_11190 [Gaiellaceae bacterium]|nr:hypothetical protein [Gaiellaceae bacterium]
MLTGPAGADLTVRVATASGCAVPNELKKLQVKTSTGSDRGDVWNLKNVPLVSGAANVELGNLPQGSRIEVDALIDPGDGVRTEVARSEAIALLRPDLTVASVVAPPQTLSVRPVDVRAEIAEQNGDVGATATATLSWGPSVLATQQVVVAPGGRTTVVFAGVALATPVEVELTVRVGNAAPAETDLTNNERSAKVDVTEHELARSRLVLDHLGGYGTQFNHHVFARITPAPPGTIGGLEPKVDALEPQIVRIFFNDRDESALFPDRLASFIDVVRMANETGAKINITYQTAVRARLNPGPFMTQFAAVLEDLVKNRGYTNIRWVTIQNEPNSAPNLTMDQYQALNRALHTELVERGLRSQIGLMVGDLVESAVNGTHRTWMTYITTHMLDIVDAYSEHIYWQYWDASRMEFRLRDVRKLMFEELPPEARRPVYLIEYGVRGHRLNMPRVLDSLGGLWENSTQIVRTNIAAFHQLWFNVAAAQLGFAGTAKWDSFWGRYDNTVQAFYMIGPAEEGWPLFPTYHALRLLFQTTAPGWQIVGVDPFGDDDWQVGVADQSEKEITAYAGPNGELTLIGLDSHGRDLNAAATEAPATYSLGGLPPATTFNLAIWNAAANGENAIGGTVTTNAAGVARFTVPLHGGFALTTVPVA